MGRPPKIRETDIREEPAREPVRKVRTRKGSGIDRLHIPRDMFPEGIDFQWVADSVLGQPATHERMAYEVNAWEPVLPDMFDGRFDGVFMPKGHKGEINVGGLVLMWRPLELTLEARAEENAAARMVMRTEEAKMRGGQIEGVNPQILDANNPAAKAKSFIRRERIPSMPIPN